jgi:transcription antitermination factor NusG
MTLSPSQLNEIEAPLWFCLKTQPKHEHIAASALRQQFALECFSPRIRFRKATRRGAVWFVEAMFPGYLFARFLYREQHRQVQYAPGIAAIVRFGLHVAAINEAAISSLRAASGEEEVIIFDPELKVGDAVQITEGAFQGLQAVVTQLLPAKERVKVLLEFLGRQVEAEVQSPKLLPTVSPRSAQLGG